MAKEIENININGEVYEVGKIYSKMGLSFERFVELLGRDLYCPTLPQAPTSSTVSYKDTDDTVNTFQAGQPCRWQEGNAWRLAVCTNNIGTSATWYVLPTKVSELTNDAEYVTESELEGKGYATENQVAEVKKEVNQYTDEKVAALVNGAPETLDTLDELAAALKDNKDIVDVLNASICNKQDNIEDLETIRQGAAKGATAVQPETLDIAIGNSKEGVFIMFHRKSDNYPLMVKPDKWASYQNGGEVADGVVVVEGGRILVVAPTETSLYWSSAAVSAGGKTTGNRQTALYDFEGKSNTTKQITHNECSSASYAPGYCAQYSRVNANGKGLTAGRWWLPSFGELMMIFANMRKINYALSLIEGATQLDETWYWSSTEYSATYAWLLYLGNGNANTNTKATTHSNVRAVSAFYYTENTIRKPWDDILSSPDLSEFTSELTNVASATKATQDGNGKVIADTYAVKDEVLGYDDVGGSVEDAVEYLTTSEQNLSDAEKERVKTNIGVNVPIIDHGTNDSTFSLTPNKYHRWGTMSSLSISLAPASDNTVVSNYGFEFTSGATPTSFSYPSDVQFIHEIKIEANKRYQGIISNGMGVLVSVNKL